MPKYPFSPAILDALPEPIAELFRGLELTLLEEICSRLKIADNLNEVTVQDIRALRSHGIDLKEIEKAIRDVTGVSQQRLNELFDQVVERNQAYYTEVIDLAEVTKPEFLVDASTIDAIRKQTKDQFKNITQTMAFVVDGGRTVLEPAKAIQWAFDSADLQIQSGAISYQTAVERAVKQLADSGLCVFTDERGVHKNMVRYESGHKDQLDVAARRAIMTGVNQVNQQYRAQSMDYLETDLVEVTAHLGARNIDGPKGWENHAAWQGKVYQWKLYKKYAGNDEEYPDFEQKCGYGDVQGIGGANCRHSFWPYVDGVSERTYTDEKLEKMKPENRKLIKFEGRLYDDYTATQKQRQIERTVRKFKRELIAYKSAGANDMATAVQVRINRLNEEYNAFSAAAGLPTQKERMNIQYA